MDRLQRAELQQLFERLASGDRSALEPACRALWPALRRFARHLLPSDGEADDAAQNALLKIVTRCSDFDVERDALTWALGITAYECKTARTRARRKRESGDTGLGEVRAPSPSPEDAAIARQLEQAATDVLGTLRPIDVETLQALMHDARPGVPGATFRKRLERALHRLQIAWRSRHGHD